MSILVWGVTFLETAVTFIEKDMSFLKKDTPPGRGDDDRVWM